MTFRDDTREIQRIVGVSADGVFGPATARAVLGALRSPPASAGAPLAARSGPSDGVSLAGGAVAAPTGQSGGNLTLRIALELIGHEAIVQEAYKDSEGVWTWGVGVTNASGHEVYPRYKDNPQPIARCLEVYIWLLRERYLPPVLRAFAGHSLSEAQLAAALSFHYNTGAILKADWVKLWKAGDTAKARSSFMNWRSPASIIPRREKERDLFFDGQWSQDGKSLVVPVSKPSYAPNFRRAKRVDVTAELGGILA